VGEKPAIARVARRSVHLPEVGRHRTLRYEPKDSKPAVLNFRSNGGTCVVPKVLESGYLALGNARFSFEQRER
jgi:hypothetical protein